MPDLADVPCVRGLTWQVMLPALAALSRSQITRRCVPVNICAEIKTSGRTWKTFRNSTGHYPRHQTGSRLCSMGNDKTVLFWALGSRDLGAAQDPCKAWVLEWSLTKSLTLQGSRCLWFPPWSVGAEGSLASGLELGGYADSSSLDLERNHQAVLSVHPQITSVCSLLLLSAGALRLVSTELLLSLGEEDLVSTAV